MESEEIANHYTTLDSGHFTDELTSLVQLYLCKNSLNAESVRLKLSGYLQRYKMPEQHMPSHTAIACTLLAVFDELSEANQWQLKLSLQLLGRKKPYLRQALIEELALRQPAPQMGFLTQKRPVDLSNLRDLKNPEIKFCLQRFVINHKSLFYDSVYNSGDAISRLPPAYSSCTPSQIEEIFQDLLDTITSYKDINVNYPQNTYNFFMHLIPHLSMTNIQHLIRALIGWEALEVWANNLAKGIAAIPTAFIPDILPIFLENLTSERARQFALIAGIVLQEHLSDEYQEALKGPLQISTHNFTFEGRTQAEFYKIILYFLLLSKKQLTSEQTTDFSNLVFMIIINFLEHDRHYHNATALVKHLDPVIYVKEFGRIQCMAYTSDYTTNVLVNNLLNHLGPHLSKEQTHTNLLTIKSLDKDFALYALPHYIQKMDSNYTHQVIELLRGKQIPNCEFYYQETMCALVAHAKSMSHEELLFVHDGLDTKSCDGVDRFKLLLQNLNLNQILFLIDSIEKNEVKQKKISARLHGLQKIKLMLQNKLLKDAHQSARKIIIDSASRIMQSIDFFDDKRDHVQGIYHDLNILLDGLAEKDAILEPYDYKMGRVYISTIQSEKAGEIPLLEVIIERNKSKEVFFSFSSAMLKRHGILIPSLSNKLTLEQKLQLFDLTCDYEDSAKQEKALRTLAPLIPLENLQDKIDAAIEMETPQMQKVMSQLMQKDTPLTESKQTQALALVAANPTDNSNHKQREYYQEQLSKRPWDLCYLEFLIDPNSPGTAVNHLLTYLAALGESTQSDIIRQAFDGIQVFCHLTTSLSNLRLLYQTLFSSINQGDFCFLMKPQKAITLTRLISKSNTTFDFSAQQLVKCSTTAMDIRTVIQQKLLKLTEQDEALLNETDLQFLKQDKNAWQKTDTEQTQLAETPPYHKIN